MLEDAMRTFTAFNGEGEWVKDDDSFVFTWGFEWVATEFNGVMGHGDVMPDTFELLHGALFSPPLPVSILTSLLFLDNDGLRPFSNICARLYISTPGTIRFVIFLVLLFAFALFN